MKVQQPSEEVAIGIAKSIKAISAQSGKHTSIKKMARLTDLKGEQLVTAVEKLSDREKRSMFQAFSELDRVVHLIKKSEEH
jgi:hypothetical protein